MIELESILKSDRDLKRWMSDHYSKPNGFVGRQLIYKVWWGDVCYGAIAAGSATKFLPNRPIFPLEEIVNQTFFHIEKQDGIYPCRNFSSRVVSTWRERVELDWLKHYGDAVSLWETLVELPRTGELYIRDGWWVIGETKGYTCKRIAGQGTDSWSGKRVWDTNNLRPKLVLIRGI